MVIDNIGCINLICFFLFGEKMYFVDSVGMVIYVYDYDMCSGIFMNWCVFVDIEGFGIFDGFCVDVEGGFWNVWFCGGCVICFDLFGMLDFIVKLFVFNVICCCIGGLNLDCLYIIIVYLGMVLDVLENI